MLLESFAVTGAAASLINVMLTGNRGSALKTGGFMLMRFIEYFFASALLYLSSAYIYTELAIDLDEPQEESSAFWRWQFGELAETVRKAFRVKLEVSGLELLPKDTRYLIVSNHRSLFDPVSMAAAFKKQEYVYISKASNFKIPIAGKVMHKCGCMALNRENNREAIVTIKRAVQMIKSDTASVVIYPEGTRSQLDEVLPFHAGSFKIAQRAGVPVVCIAMRDTDKVVHRGPILPTTVHIDVAGVIDADFVGKHTTKETAELAHKIIQEKLDIEKNS